MEISKNKIDAQGEYEVKVVRASSLAGGKTPEECLADGEYESLTKNNRVFRSWYNYLGLFGGGSGQSGTRMFNWADLNYNNHRIALITGAIDEGQAYETSQSHFGGFSSQVGDSWIVSWNSKTVTTTGFTLGLTTSKVVGSALSVSGIMLTTDRGVDELEQGVGWKPYPWGYYNNNAISLVKLSNNISLGVGDTIYITYKLSTFFTGSDWRRTKITAIYARSSLNNQRYIAASEKLAPVNPARVYGYPSRIDSAYVGGLIANYDWNLTVGFSGNHTRSANTEECVIGTAYTIGGSPWEPAYYPENSRLVLGWNSVAKPGVVYRSQVIKRKTGINLLVDGANPPTSRASISTSGGDQIPRNVFYNVVVQSSGASSSTSSEVTLTSTVGQELISISVDLTSIGITDPKLSSPLNVGLAPGELFIKVMSTSQVKLATSQANLDSNVFIIPSTSEVVVAKLSLATVLVNTYVKDSGLDNSLPYIWSDADQGVPAYMPHRKEGVDADTYLQTSYNFANPGQAIIWTSYDSASNRIFHGTRTHGLSGIFESDRNNFSSAIVSWNYNTVESGYEEELVTGTSCGDCLNGDLVVGFFGNKIRHYSVGSGFTFVREVATSAPVHSAKFDNTTGIAWLHLFGTGIAKYVVSTGALTEYTVSNTFTTLTSANFNYLTKSLDIHNGMLVLGYNSRIPTRIDWYGAPSASLTGILLGQLILDTTNFNYGLINKTAVGNYGTPRWVIPSRGTDRNSFAVSFVERNGMDNSPQTEPATIRVCDIQLTGQGVAPICTLDPAELITFGANISSGYFSSPVVVGIHLDNNGLSTRMITRGSSGLSRGAVAIYTLVKPKGQAYFEYNSIPFPLNQDNFGGVSVSEAVQRSLTPVLGEIYGIVDPISCTTPAISGPQITHLTSIARLNGCAQNQHNCLYINGILHVLKGIVLMPIPKVEYIGPAVNLTLPSSGLNIAFQNAGGFPSTSQLVAGECYNFGVGPAIIKTGLTTVTFPYAFPTRPTREVTFPGTSPSGAPGTVQPAETLTRWFHDVFLGAPMTITVNGSSRVLASAAPTAGQVWVDILGKITFHSSDYSQPYSITCTCQEQFN